jgi:two-component system phosphate regulon response regulator PhoB
MPGKQILIVEDERPIREMIAFGLRRGGFDVREAADVAAARSSIANQRPDLVLIDWMLPDMSGLELTRAIKRDIETQDVPVIMLTARAEEQDKVMGLDSGADDYVTKPFSPRELLARINAVLRRSNATNGEEMIEAEGLVLDGAGHRVTAGDRTIQLGPTESGCTVERNCWIAYGAGMFTLKSVLSMCTSGVCVRRWKRSTTTDSFKRSAVRGIDSRLGRSNA